MKLRTSLAAVVVFAVAGGACSASSTPEEEGAAPSAGFPVTIEADNGPVTIPSRPERVVSLSPTSTESLFAIGAGGQVVAVDTYSDHPVEAPRTDLDGLQVNLEAIASYDPDLVVLSFDPGEVIAGLEAIGITVLMQSAAATLDDVYGQITDLGLATGNAEAATQLVAAMNERIEAAAASVPTMDPAPTYYHELDEALDTLTSSTFAGSLYDLVGLENIADPADLDGFGYPQLNAEYIITTDPDFVFLADTKCCGQNVTTIAARPGWGTLAAVSSGRVVELDDDIASRWGPRVVDFMDAIAGAVRDFGSSP